MDMNNSVQMDYHKTMICDDWAVHMFSVIYYYYYFFYYI